MQRIRTVAGHSGRGEFVRRLDHPWSGKKSLHGSSFPEAAVHLHSVRTRNGQVPSSKAATMARETNDNEDLKSRFSPRRMRRTLSSLRIAERTPSSINKSDQTVETLTTASTASMSSPGDMQMSPPARRSTLEHKEKPRFSIASPKHASSEKASESPNQKPRAPRASLSGFLDEGRKTSRKVKSSSKTVAPKTPEPKVRSVRRRSVGHGSGTPPTPSSPPPTPSSPAQLQDIFTAYDEILKDFDGSFRIDSTGW
jgi:hypothetical protein